MSNNSVVALDAKAVISPFETFSPGRILIRENRIEAVGKVPDVTLPQDVTPVDLAALTLVPGFIEPHIHGCAGRDVMDASRDSMTTISKALASHGTTAFLPTTVSAPINVLTAAIESLASLMQTDFGGAQPLGIHLEGPFINAGRRGTHDPGNVHTPDPAILSDWIQRSNGSVRLLTLAPELDGAPGVVQLARASGVVVGMGHSDATLEEALAAVDAGMCYAVHTFNAMRPFSHRDPGIIGAVLSDDRIFAEIISDGIHVAPEVVRIFARSKGRSCVILATDATSATDMPDGQYALGKSMIQVVDGVCRDNENRLAGSTLTQDRALRNFIEWTGMRIDDALRALTSNPAEVLSLEGRGRLEPGTFADITALDDRLHVARTYVGGKLVFERPS